MAKVIKRTAFLTTILTVCMTILYALADSDLALTLAITCGTIAYHFLMRLLVGWIVNAVLHNNVNYHHKWFRLCPFEQKLYTLLKVKKWKGSMPTYDPKLFDIRYHTFTEIIGAMCQAEIVHEIIVIGSFLPLFTVPWFGAFWVFLITSVCAACFDLLFVIMQRYNRPRIIKLAEKAKS